MGDDNVGISANMPREDPREEPIGLSQTPYDAPRGTCPRCASPEVVHLVIGMPIGPEEWGNGPEWVHWVGCMHPGYSRRCEACNATWDDSPEVDRAYLSVAALIEQAGVDSLKDLADWISEDYDLDAWLERHGETLEIGFQRHSVRIKLPVGIVDFWDALDDLHDEAAQAPSEQTGASSDY